MSLEHLARAVIAHHALQVRERELEVDPLFVQDCSTVDHIEVFDGDLKCLRSCFTLRQPSGDVRVSVVVHDDVDRRPGNSKFEEIKALFDQCSKV